MILDVLHERMKRRKKIAIAVFLGIALLYVGTYMALSAHGQYKPASWRAEWPGKPVAWVPRGFVVTMYKPDPGGGRSQVGERSSVLQVIFLPLWAVDVYLIHNKGKLQNKSIDGTSL